MNSAPSSERLKTRFQQYSDRVTVLQKDNLRGIKDADVVMLGCKPYMVEQVLSEPGLAEALGSKLLISFLVGTPHEKILKSIYGADEITAANKKFHLVRAMMNIAAEFGESMTVIEDVPLPVAYEEVTHWIFEQLGKISIVKPDLFDIGGVMAGMSGVLLSVALDGILDGAVSQGIRRAEGRRMLAQNLKGLARLLESGDTPDVLREKFSSPRGTTIEGLMSLEEDRVRSAYSKAIIKATKRSLEM